MNDVGIEAWQAFAGVAGVVILLGGVAVALQRLGILRRESPSASASLNLVNRIDLLEARLKILETEIGAISAMRESIRETHRRIDAVSQTADRVEGKIGELSHTSSLVLQHLISREAA